MLHSDELKLSWALKSVPNQFYRLVDSFWCILVQFRGKKFHFNFCLTIPHSKSQNLQNSIFSSKKRIFTKVYTEVIWPKFLYLWTKIVYFEVVCQFFWLYIEETEISYFGRFWKFFGEIFKNKKWSSIEYLKKCRFNYFTLIT